MDEGRRVWLYNFKLHISASEVYIVADFDDWSKNNKMIQISEGVFEKEVILPDLEKIYYEFDVDGYSMIDPSSKQEVHSDNQRRNVLIRRQTTYKHPLQYLSQLSPYPYQRLDFDNHEIRLLTLDLSVLPRSIHGSMAHISLISPGPYNALSYCWGDSTNKETVVLDGVAVPVTESLFFALRNVLELARRETHSALFKLWVDALCINQADAEERSSQVRNMRQIYSRASRVIAAVGQPERLVCDWRHHYTSDSVAFLIKNRNNYKVTKNNDDKHVWLWRRNEWSILQMFFNEPYWTRAWVIQELTVAVNVIILYADVEIKWEDVAAILMTWKSSNEPNSSPITACRRALHLLEFRERFSINREPIRLLDALRWSHNTRATDPRDKIYALLGLCYDWQTYVPLPNYKQPLEVIIADMTKSMMRLNRSLDLICFKGPNFPKENTGPTWLPNCFNLGHESITPVEQKILDQNIACHHNPIMEELENFQLVVKSVKVFTISKIGSGMEPYDKQYSSTPYRQGWISETPRLADKNPQLAIPTAHDFMRCQLIWRVLTMSLAPQTLSNETIGCCFSILWTSKGRGAIHNIDLIRWIDTNAWFKIGPWTLREWSRMGTSSESPIPQVAATDFDTFVESLEQVLGSGMRLCEMTRLVPENYFVCLAPSNAAVSDEVHCIQGCSVPVVLRKNTILNKTTAYHVIGGGHIEGLAEAFMDFIKGGVAPPGFQPSNIILM